MEIVHNPDGSVANPWYEYQWEQLEDSPLDIRGLEKSVRLVVTGLQKAGGTFPYEFTVYRSRGLVTGNGVVNRYTVSGIATCGLICDDNVANFFQDLLTTKVIPEDKPVSDDDVIAIIEALDNADVPRDNRKVWPNGGKS